MLPTRNLPTPTNKKQPDSGIVLDHHQPTAGRRNVTDTAGATEETNEFHRACGLAINHGRTGFCSISLSGPPDPEVESYPPSPASTMDRPIPLHEKRIKPTIDGGNSGQPQQTGGLFGSVAPTSQPPQSGGLFGASTSQPAQTSGLFGATQTQSPQTQKPGGLFGFGNNAQPSTSQPATSTSGSLFGAAPAIATAQPAAGGLFGSNTAASKPGGLFGATATTSQPAVGGLFGTTPASSAPAATGGLFGASTSTPVLQPSGGLFGRVNSSAPTAGGLFGSAAPASSAPATNSLFSAPAANQTTINTGGLFGSRLGAASTPSNQPASGGLFGALNNANPQQPQPQVQAVKVDWSNVKSTTRFSELDENAQNQILMIDDLIQGAMKASMQCSEALPNLGRAVESLPGDVEYLEQRLETVEGAIGRDAVAVGHNKSVVEKDSEDAVRLFRAIENLKLPNQFHYSTISGGGGSAGEAGGDVAATDLLGYFNNRAGELEKHVEGFAKGQKEVEMHLRTVEFSAVERLQKLGRRREAAAAGNNESGVDVSGEGLREIAGVMRTFEEAILRVAERVGEGREKVVDLSLGSGLLR